MYINVWAFVSLCVASLVINVIVGYVVKRHYEQRYKLAMKPICPCKHAISFHEKMTGACVGRVKAPYGTKRCTCLHYAGPEMISMFTGRDLTSG